MKKSKIILPMAMVIAFGFFSCQKEKNEESGLKKQEEVTGKQNLPHYDETNSKIYTWETLPEELRNAKPFSELEAKLSTKRAITGYDFAVGPWGGSGGGYYECIPPTQQTKVYSMAIRSGARVDKISIWYKHQGEIYIACEAGGSGGGFHLQFFDEDEYIKEIIGNSGARLDRIGIKTNKKYFAYGGWGGSPFRFSVPQGYHINGFFGRSGAEVDALGVYVSRL